jgi:hypothetical protein
MNRHCPALQTDWTPDNLAGCAIFWQNAGNSPSELGMWFEAFQIHQQAD